MPEFIKGLALSQTFFHQPVSPLLEEGFPTLVYSAGRVGYGSDVLGFDTPMSTDHDWGPQVQLFLLSDSTDINSYPKRSRKLRALYEP